MKRITRMTKVLTVALLLLLTKQSFAQCAASFTYNIGSSGSVTFTSTSITLTTATVYYWTYGNGIPTYSATGSAGMYPSYTYTANGTYTVTLFILSSIPSCSTSASAVITITNSSGCGLLANFSTSQGSNGLVNFNNTSTGTISGVTYNWAFGDGGTSTATSPAHTYSANGTYIATLTANNNTTPTCMATKTLSILVNTYCTLTAGFTYSYLANGMVAFYNNTTPTTTATYTWNFINNSPPTSNLTNPLITYSANGTYTVNLLAKTSSPSCTANATAVITITNATGCNLTANFSVSQGTNGLVNFSNTSTGTNSTNTYAWNFGNSQTSTLTSPSITYTANGSYPVTLVVTNSGTPSCVSTKTMMVNVNSICPLQASFTYTSTSNGGVMFMNTSAGSSSITQATWNFGHSSAPNFGTATGNYVYNQYPPGTFTVTLTVSNGSFCSSSVTQVITSSCSINAAFTHTAGSSGLVNFSNASTGYLVGAHYYWNFGDGWTSTNANPNHTYSSAGTHYVSLTVTDSTNVLCSSTTTQALNITGIPCNANPNFSLTPTSTPQVWNAIPAYPYNVTAATWSWGDGSSSNSLYTSHQYSAAANYTICLTVTVSCGATASTCSNYYVSKSAGQTGGIVYINVVEPENRIETGIMEEKNEVLNFSLYPNPNQGSFAIRFSESPKAGTDITLFDLLGNKVYSETVQAYSSSELTIKAPELTAGIYFLKIDSSSKTSTQKVIIQK